MPVPTATAGLYEATFANLRPGVITVVSSDRLCTRQAVINKFVRTNNNKEPTGIKTERIFSLVPAWYATRRVDPGGRPCGRRCPSDVRGGAGGGYGGSSPIEETVAAGNRGLQYDPATQTYTYVWKTNSNS